MSVNDDNLFVGLLHLLVYTYKQNVMKMLEQANFKLQTNGEDKKHQ